MTNHALGSVALSGGNIDGNYTPLQEWQHFVSSYDFAITEASNGTPVPEPASLLLLGSGCAAFIGHAWRRRRGR